ncbi:DUF4082 domain-containing protein [Cellulomonas soli]|uniref:Ig-like domain-containing protein n=1 Tax=Cellulomonas soli TaxID=931535 RepID=A0A512PH21_9CELL|nr:DUF4082 domain-containing protein [Cellulomonas soli]NYI59693.1 hypothetical protein [Cellulomonas soli]GEP70487.1 hypothetical protein CSO01_32020 [Cellulomonas soli]
MSVRPRSVLASVTALALGVPLMMAAVATPAAATDPCAVGGNPIVCENSKPGADPSEWDIDGAGDEGIQGFSTAISVNVGGTIDFKIDTAATAYTIDIYRTGWYDGLGARKIASVTPSATLPQTQPQCYTDATTELYDCGNWAVSASWHVPAAAVSGVYVAHLQDPATGDESHITFVVRNDASTSDVIFQTSDTTWQAYNAYGGSDYYQGAANGRAYKISYNRPFATRAGVEKRDFYFGNEFPMVRFLERNGYDVSYQSGLDTDARGALLLNHDVFLSVGHDEYWSGPQRANVEAARDAGVDLAFFSGNEMYWRTRWEPSVAGTATDDRTLVSYKETWSDAKIDPSTEWTGTSRDPRFASAANGGGSPENAVTGTMYMANDSDLALTVSAEEGKLRLWRGTGLDAMSGTSTTLAAHTVGYESDEDLDNGFRPEGLIRLSTTTGAVNSYLQDFGTVVKSGTTTHHLTMYRADSGALVFSAGSIQWSWGLDAVHDGVGAAADPRIQQATVNLLADMGAQPTTLMSTLVAATASSDTTAPVVQVTSPTAGAAVANGTSLTVSGTATDAGGRVAGVEVSLDGGTTWHPATGTATWTYTGVLSGNGAVQVLARGIDDSANIGQAVTRSLTTACPCSIYGQSVPAVASVDDSTPVELGLTFTPQAGGFVTAIRFYKGTGNTGTHVGSLWSATGTRLATVTFTGETASGWQTAQLSSAVAVQAGTSYVVSYTAPQGRYAAQSGAFWYTGRSAPPLSVAGGFGATGAGVYAAPGQFPTLTWGASQYYVDVLFSATDSTPFAVASQWPVAGATGTPLGSVLTAQLSRAPDGGAVTMTLTAAGGAAVTGSTTYDAATRTATFVPDGSLTASTTYTATVSATSGGQALGGQVSWTFTTASLAQSAGASTVTLYDDSAVPGVLQDADTSAVTLGVKFSSSVAGYVTGVRFYKGPNNTGTHVGALWLAGSTTPLATATFTAESASGWQTVAFGSPVHIDKGTQYIASYRTTAGRYSATVGAFSGLGLQRPPLSTSADSGAYSYADGYPGSTSSTSYMVDVVFTRDKTALTSTSVSPAAGQTAVDVDSAVSASFNLALSDAATLSLAAGGTSVAGTLARADGGKTLTFTPTSPLPAGTLVTATASGLASANGSTAENLVWTFTTAGTGGCPCTLFGERVPAVASANDGAKVELGVSFVPSVAGTVTGVRFYKGAANTGTHTGTLWSSTGEQLRTVTFVGETASGWQTALFSSPYAVTPGQTYVVSYLAPSGGYSATASAFAADLTVGPLTVPATGNGRYKYGGGFPTSSWQQTNYFVDAVFETAPAAPPTVTTRTPATNATDVAVGTTVTAVLSASQSTAVPTITVQAGGATVAGQQQYVAGSRTLTFQPAAALPAGAVVSVVVAVDGQALEGGSWSFTTTAVVPAPDPVSFWTTTDVPTYPAWDDSAAVQVGTRFSTSAAGAVTAIRFYKGATNTGTHTVKLWDASGTLLAEAPSTGETASGWQTVALASPVTLVPGTTYIAAYHSTTGRYAVTPNALATARTSGPLTTAVPGGAYVYGTGLPSGTSNASYGVDVVFAPAG